MFTTLQKTIITSMFCLHISHLQAMKVNSPTYRSLIENIKKTQSDLTAQEGNVNIHSTRYNFDVTPHSTKDPIQHRMHNRYQRMIRNNQ
jgi:hypothetical protein